MHSSLARSASVAVTWFLTSALLAGCGSTGSIPGAPSGASQTSLFGSASLGPAHRIGNEVLSSSQVTSVCRGTSSKFVMFSTTGTTTGPFPGTFSASGSFDFKLGADKISFFTEKFMIVSGANTINGSMTWGGRSRVTAQCTGGGGGLNAGSGFHYTATLTQGTKTKTFNGPASESGIYRNHFGETLI